MSYVDINTAPYTGWNVNGTTSAPITIRNGPEQWQDYYKMIREYEPVTVREITVTNAPLKKYLPYRLKISEIERVVFNGPATVVIWKDGTKTVVKCGNYDIYDPEKGLAMAICKYVFGNDGTFKHVFKDWLPEEEASGELAGTPIGSLSSLIKQIFSPVEEEDGN